MLLNTVVFGKGYKTMANKPTLIKLLTSHDPVSVVTLYFFGGALMRQVLGEVSD